MSRQLRLAFAFLILPLLYACEGRPPTDVLGPGAPTRDISDGTQTEGNERFYFLPPMVDLPAFTAAFNPSLFPLIEICDRTQAGSWDAETPDPLNEPAFCAEPLATFTRASGDDGQTINVSTTDEHYHINWHTDHFPIDQTAVYRIRVFIHQFNHDALALAADPALELPQLLGYADVQLADNMQELKNLSDGTTIALVDGRTLPIKVRIEEGASCGGATDCGEGVVDSNGGLVVTEDNTAGVSVPQGAVDNPILIKIKRLNPTAQPTGRCLPSGQPQKEGCYNFDTEPEISDVNGGFEKFRELVTVGVCMLERDTGEGYSLHKHSPERPGEGVIQLPPVPANDAAGTPFLDCTDFSAFAGLESTYFSRFAAATGRLLRPVLGPIMPRVLYAGDLLGGLDDSFSDYGHLKAVNLQKEAGDGQSGTVGTTLPLTAVVTAIEDHVEPDGTAGTVADVDLVFTFTDPSGNTQVVVDPVTTLADGTASNTWTLSSNPGLHELSVRVAGEPRRKASTFTTQDGSVVLEFTDVDPVVFTATAVSPALGSRIAFTTARGGAGNAFDLYTMNDDGTDPLLLFSSEGVDASVSWSPDGTQVAFASNDDGDFEIYVMNVDGTGLVKLTDNSANDDQPDWSSTGKIAFRSFRNNANGELWVMDADGSNQAAVTTTTAARPDWSPDGSKIVYHGDILTPGNDDIIVIEADGTNPVNLTSGTGADEFQPAWSPDGTRIAFVRGPADIWVVDAATGAELQLTNNTAIDREPEWSPDGARIAFASDRDGDLEIYTMDADGNNVVRLTNSLGFDAGPAWQPAVPITFETFADGTAVQVGHVTTEWSDLGVVFSYVTFDGLAGQPRVCDSTSLSPAGVASDHALTWDDTQDPSGTACSPSTLGTITMTFSEGPSNVAFKVARPSIGGAPSLSAEDVAGTALAVTLVSSVVYPAQNGASWTEDTYRVRSTAGVQSIEMSQGAGGAVQLIDDLGFN